MPALIDSPSTPVALAPMVAPENNFEILKQKVWLDVNPLSIAQSISGRTEITVRPATQEARVLKLNSKQARITRWTSTFSKPSKLPTKEYKVPKDYRPPYARANLPGTEHTAEQWASLQQRLSDQFAPVPEPELHLNFGKTRYPELGPEQMVVGTGSQDIVLCELIVLLEFEIDRVRDGLQFVGCDPEDMRYPHVYTSAYAGSASSCVFPCSDDDATRCEWEISIKTPKTIGDALATSGRPLDVGLRFNEEDKARDLVVICAGELTDELDDKHDKSMKETTFHIEARVHTRHVGFAVGPFEQVSLHNFRESVQDDKLGQSSMHVYGFCLPGRAEEVRNTCFPLVKAIDSFATSYHKYPFNNCSYKAVFVDDMVDDSRHCASLSLCSSRLLFPEDILEPMNRVTRYLAFCVASQWFGVSIVPEGREDTWVVVGIAYFMADTFMKQLAGTNEYRYFQKRQADRVFERDVRRPSLLVIGSNLYLDPSQMEFLALKGSMVMFILDRRLIKSNGTVGLSRIITKTIVQANYTDGTGAISTQHFMRMCEKYGHHKLETFFKQWAEDAGCPHFQVTQRFNKKRLVVEMVIKQVQHEAPDDQTLKADEFHRDAREEEALVDAGELQAVFRGPMTIRIHEADGTPYEHIVEIKDMITRIEIPYNTKYKRLKRTRRNKEKLSQGVGNMDEDSQSGLYMLGDNLQSDEDLRNWRLTEFTKEEDERMNSESFEWIRMDADFEWICRMQFNMPPHMYLSQLQQDRDVVAQLESITYFANSKENALVSTFLVRTLMDRRYFYGIRSAAATALSKHARDEVGWIGLFHLKKAFQTMFCLPNGMIRPNDFSDRALHYIQCAVVRSMGMIRDNSGRAPYEVRKFLYETLRYNDNSANEFSDAHFLQAVMRALGSAVASAPPLESDIMDTDLENADDIAFFRSALEEIDRHRRLDEWLPSYHNTLTIEGLNAKSDLMRANRIPRDPREFLRYTQVASHGDVRVAAFDHLLDLGFTSDPRIMEWFLFNLSGDNSAHIRKRLMILFGRWLGLVATGQLKQNQAEPDAATDGLVLEAEAAVTAAEADEARKKTIKGALAALKMELGEDAALKKNLWSAVMSPALSLFEVELLLQVCSWLYDPVDRCLLVLKYPHYWQVRLEGPTAARHDGFPSLMLRFSRTKRIRTKRIERWQPPTNDTITLAPKVGTKRKSSTFQSSETMPAPKTKIQKRASMPNGRSASPAGTDERAKPSLKLKLKMPGAASPPAVQTPGAQTPGGSIKLKLKLPPAPGSGR